MNIRNPGSAPGPADEGNALANSHESETQAGAAPTPPRSHWSPGVRRGALGLPLDYSRPVVVEPADPGVNPYLVEGRNMAPSPVPRVCGTKEALAAALREGLLLRGMTVEEAAARAGIPASSARRAASAGTGSLSEVRDLLDALGVDPVGLPACLTRSGYAGGVPR